MSPREARQTFDWKVVVEKIYLKKIAPKVRELSVIDDQIRASLNEIISKNREDISEYKEMIERYPHILLEEYPREKKIKGKRLTEQAKELNQRRTTKEAEIEKKMHVIERMLRVTIDETGVTYLPDTSKIPEIDLIEPVQLYASEQDNLKQSYSLNTVMGFQDIKGYMRRRFLKDRYLSIRIDLRYNKNEILEHCGKAIKIAQNAIGKTGTKGRRGKESTAMMKQEIFEYHFREHVEEGLSKNKALKKIVEDFYEYGITIEHDTLDKKYYKPFKDRMGAKDFTELKKKMQC
jgi:hypothetical protein